MGAVTRTPWSVARLGLVAGLVSSAAIPAAAAQAPSITQHRNVATRSECPVEPHPVAINPDVVECHARFAPLPTFPPAFEKGNAAHLEILRTKEDVLLRQLDRPEACGKGANVRPDEYCAILVYVIDEKFRQDRLPWTYIVRIYRTSHPPEGRLREMKVRTGQSNNSERDYGPTGATDEVWKLLADQRVTVRCRPATREFLHSSLSAGGQMSRPDACHRMADDVRYHPVLLIGRGEAKRVLNRKSIRHNFRFN